MIELFQIPWSPYCLAVERMLGFAGAPFKRVAVPVSDRAAVWKLTRERYYQVPVLRDGRNVVFETESDSQVIAKYLDAKLGLGLFPAEWEGVQSLVWRYIENELEGVTFRLNDIHWREFVPRREHAGFVRHKERKFGRGCLDQWAAQEPALLAELEAKLLPFEEMLTGHPFLLAERPYFVDFDLLGILGNLLFTGHYGLPPRHVRLRDWQARVAKARLGR